MGGQMLTEFMTRRYDPAMRTAKSAEGRLARMLDRTERAGELLRTRVDVWRGAQNQDCCSAWTAAPICNCACNIRSRGCRWWRSAITPWGWLGYRGAAGHALGIDKAVLIAIDAGRDSAGVWLGDAADQGAAASIIRDWSAGAGRR
jgi:hypothetical protein